MAVKLKMALWNANGFSQHQQEIQVFLYNESIDILLISETHFTHRSYPKLQNYIVYHTNHPSGAAHGGTAIIIKKSIKHFEIPKYEHDFLQATSLVVEDWNGPITIAAIYCPPKHKIKKELFEQFFHSLGNKFIAGGDFNAKHTQWGCRLVTTRGRELLKSMRNNNLNHVSTAEPTYWPTDRSKTPDLLDFCIIKGISSKYIKATSCFDLSSDHSPVFITLSTEVLKTQKPLILCNKSTNWIKFRHQISEVITYNVPLKTPSEINDAVQQLTVVIQEAAWSSTSTRISNEKYEEIPIIVRDKIAAKRKLRKIWQRSQAPGDKNKLNRATRELKNLLINLKRQSIQDYLKDLSPSEASDYSLFKATKKINQPQQQVSAIRLADGNWARTSEEKANAFAHHLSEVFKPYPAENTTEEELQLQHFIETPFQMDLPLKNFTIGDVKSVIELEINPKKSPGFDLITGKILKELPEQALRVILFIFNAILRIGYFPEQWKVAKVILINKPGKNATELQSYRPISLLPILSKLFEKILLKRLRPILHNKKLIPEHQFGFRIQHGTVEQVHRVIDKISKDLEGKRYCSAAFLDISQAFDKVWHTGLLYKLKLNLPYQYYNILKSYLEHRHFFVNHQNQETSLHPIYAGVPQGSVLGPILYILYTADLPTTRKTMTATFADDTAVLASHADPIIASNNLQQNLAKTEDWMRKWRMRANRDKSTHVTYTLRRGTCPPVIFNNEEIPQADCVKYLGLHLDRSLTWKKHIITKRKQLGLKFQKMYWLMGKASQLSTENKILLYKSIIKPIWTYGIQLWGTASNSNIEILQRFQSKVLRCIVDAPWYVPNVAIHSDLQINSVKEEIRHFSVKYNERLNVHPNRLAVNLLQTENVERRLKRFKPSDLSERF